MAVILNVAKRTTKDLHVIVPSSSMIPSEKILHSRFATFRMTAQETSLNRPVKCLLGFDLD